MTSTGIASFALWMTLFVYAFGMPLESVPPKDPETYAEEDYSAEYHNEFDDDVSESDPDYKENDPKQPSGMDWDAIDWENEPPCGIKLFCEMMQVSLVSEEKEDSPEENVIQPSESSDKEEKIKDDVATIVDSPQFKTICAPSYVSCPLSRDELFKGFVGA